MSITNSEMEEINYRSGKQKEFDLIIEEGRTEGNYWRDIWHYRGLFYFLSWRDILVRYKQTVIQAFNNRRFK